MSPDNHHLALQFVDVVAGLTAVATIFGFLPGIAAALTILWTGMRIYDWIAGKVRAHRAKK